MKKYIKNIAIVLTVLLTFSSCQDDDKTFGDINSPSGIEVEAVILGVSEEFPDGDGSGKVDFTAKAKNATNFKYIFSDGTEINSPSGIAKKTFTTEGTITYTVTVLASGTAGVSSSMSFEITVFSNFKDPAAIDFLTGGGSKKWYFAANEVGHLGVGPNNDNAGENGSPIWYAAQPFEKAGSPDSSCLYDNELTFSLVDGQLKYELDNGGRTFYNAAFHSFGGGDLCLDLNTSGQKSVFLSPSESVLTPDQSRKTTMTFSDGGFMGYFVNQTVYEIIEITENRMVVRAIMGNDPALAWYHIFTTTKPVQGGGGVGETFENLVWADEFDVPGAPNPANWGYDLGAGGWGNGELQFYRDHADNVKVEGGFLKITAKKQTFSGAPYTSARIKTEGKQDWTYGKVEARIKLPEGVGTWPAFWMLGSNFSQVSWPACGEIDIMEHKGFQPGIIHGTLHYPGFSGGGGPTQSTTVANVSSEFHNYSVIWTASTIRFFVDDNLFHTFNNNGTTPFNADFFIILNVAMGGTFGGPVDPAFVQSTMEVDYVRVYQ
ncbi:hypothetical protein J2X31_002388 [Flavobacterium arsenatis]|uniref:GH16 domain-containing protein n=1 Tax=Flavobacterium arsenatis TaxID=1484332 RepID=A0ABU1TQU5_9FLAO|nr:family 16 glycosylhydrolase [Flavobacterium arsenatis]MDR6968365.1 hypothetical protein [Flavobacterium arsenatis]